MKASSSFALVALATAAVADTAGTFSLDIAKRSKQDATQAHRHYRRQQDTTGTVEESVFDVLAWSNGGAYYTNSP